MRSWPAALVLLLLACGRREAAPSRPPQSEAASPSTPTSKAEGGIIGIVQRPERLTGEFSDALLMPYVIAFAIPEGIELTKAKGGEGYQWESTGEPGAIILRWRSARRTDELLRGDDPAGAMSSVLIQSFGGTAEHLVDRQVLTAPSDIVGVGWRVDAPRLTGWVAIYTNGGRPAAKAEDAVLDIFIVIVLGARGTPTAYDGAVARAIRESVRFERLDAR